MRRRHVDDGQRRAAMAYQMPRWAGAGRWSCCNDIHQPEYQVGEFAFDKSPLAPLKPRKTACANCMPDAPPPAARKHKGGSWK